MERSHGELWSPSFTYLRKDSVASDIKASKFGLRYKHLFSSAASIAPSPSRVPQAPPSCSSARSHTTMYASHRSSRYDE